jgi:glycosyltransferase involved in cell wall biosynthesis
MNIVQVPRRFVQSAWGGTETVVLETCKRLLALGHHAAVLCPNALADRDQEVVEGVEVRRLPYFYPYWGLRGEARRQLDQKGGNLFSFPLMKALRRYPALDLVHLHTAKRIGGIVRRVARERRIPYVVSLHGGVCDVPAAEAQSWTAPTRGTLEWGKVLGWWVGSRRVLDDAAAILCVGQEEQRLMQERYPRGRVLYLPNGVDAERFSRGDGRAFRRRRRIPPQARVVLVVGRVAPQKNQLFAVRALPRMLEAAPDAHLLLVGGAADEAYRDRLSREVALRGMGPRVTLTGELAGQELVDAYHAADLFLLPSIHEPFGIVILEAWAAGLPVLASRVGGVPGFVADGRDGLLFAAGDEGEFLRAFGALAADRERCGALASAGRAKTREQYTWDRIGERLAAIYEEVVHDHSLRKREVRLFRRRGAERGRDRRGAAGQGTPVLSGLRRCGGTGSRGVRSLVRGLFQVLVTGSRTPRRERTGF